MTTAHLVVTSRLPLPKRQRALRPIRSQVDDVEWLSARIGTSAIEVRGYEAVGAGLADIAERLEILDRSRALLADDCVEVLPDKVQGSSMPSGSGVGSCQDRQHTVIVSAPA